MSAAEMSSGKRRLEGHLEGTPDDQSFYSLERGLLREIESMIGVATEGQ